MSGAWWRTTLVIAGGVSGALVTCGEDEWVIGKEEWVCPGTPVRTGRDVEGGSPTDGDGVGWSHFATGRRRDFGISFAATLYGRLRLC